MNNARVIKDSMNNSKFKPIFIFISIGLILKDEVNNILFTTLSEGAVRADEGTRHLNSEQATTLSDKPESFKLPSPN